MSFFKWTIVLLTVLLGFVAPAGAAEVDPYTRLWPTLEKADLKLLPVGSSSAPVATSVPAVKAKVRIVLFWASWCPHCRRAIENLNKMALEYKPGDLEIIGIGVEMKEEKAIEYARSLKQITGSTRVHLFFDKKGVLREQLSVPALPTLSVLGPDNKIIATYTGFGNEVMSHLKRRVFRELEYGEEGT